MNHFLAGFADELTKEAGVVKGVLGSLARHPIRTFMGGSILAGTASAAKAGYKSGLRGGEKGRYLQATRDNPGQAALINFHQLFKHKPTAKEIENLSKHHKASTFSSYGSGASKKSRKNK